VHRLHVCHPFLLLKLGALETRETNDLGNDAEGLVCDKARRLDTLLDTLLMANDIMSNLFKETIVFEKSN
jgi:hypothetical protein